MWPFLSGFFVVQSLSCVRFFVTTCTAVMKHVSLPSPSLSPRICSNHLILCCPLLLLTSIFPSIRVFLNELLFTSGSQSTGASASPSVLPVEYSGLISFRADWLDLLKVQGTFMLLSQEYSPAPQLESINPSALSLIKGPTLTSLYLQ